MHEKQIERLTNQPLISGSILMLVKLFIPLIITFTILLFPVILYTFEALESVDFFEDWLPYGVNVFNSNRRFSMLFLLIALNSSILTLPLTYLILISVKLFAPSRDEKSLSWSDIFHPKGFGATFLFLFGFICLGELCLVSLLYLDSIRWLRSGYETLYFIVPVVWMSILAFAIAFIPVVVYGKLSIWQGITTIWRKSKLLLNITFFFSILFYTSFLSLIYYWHMDWMYSSIFRPLRKLSGDYLLGTCFIFVELAFFVCLPLLSIMIAVYYKYYHNQDNKNDNELIYDALVE